MAVSGGVLVGFVIGHFLGNLNLYLGPEHMNGYAEKLKSMPALLWGTRFLLLFAVGAHIASAFQLWSRKRAARTTRYAKHRDLATDYAARTMYLSGPILLLFIAYHLYHFTLAPSIPGDVYATVVSGFQQPAVAAVYIAGNLALGFHLFHGVHSAFQSLGINHPSFNDRRRSLAVAIAALVTLGNISFPLSVLAGLVKA
jgi:succinate dehydrogenase cytochrome b subunit